MSKDSKKIAVRLDEQTIDAIFIAKINAGLSMGIVDGKKHLSLIHDEEGKDSFHVRNQDNKKREDFSIVEIMESARKNAIHVSDINQFKKDHPRMYTMCYDRTGIEKQKEVAKVEDKNLVIDVNALNENIQTLGSEKRIKKCMIEDFDFGTISVGEGIQLYEIRNGEEDCYLFTHEDEYWLLYETRQVLEEFFRMVGSLFQK